MRESQIIQFELGLKPISVNKYFQGRKFITKEGKDFRAACYDLLPKRMEQTRGLVEVEIIVYLKKAWLNNDCDNFLKALLDVLQSGGIIENDRFITDLTIRKRQAEEDRVAVKIKKSIL